MSKAAADHVEIRRRNSLHGRYDLLDLASVDGEEQLHRAKHPALIPDAHFSAQPWFGWLFAYAVVIAFFSVYRFATFDALIAMYGGTKDFTVLVMVTGLGFLEDAVCATYFVYVLWAFDSVKQAVNERLKRQGSWRQAAFENRRRAARIISSMATFLVSFSCFVAMMVPFVVDMLVVRFRELRFTMEILVLAYNEIGFLDAAPISAEEFEAGYLHATIIGTVAALFASVRTKAAWADLAAWSPMHIVVAFESRPTPELTRRSKQTATDELTKFSIEEGPDHSACADKHENYKRVPQAAVLFIVLVAFPLFVVGVSSSSSPVVTFSALNATLNQFITQALLPRREIFAKKTDSTRHAAWAETFIHGQTEEYELFGDNSLFRRTTGFRGDLAFDVDVDANDLPNVILISLESFRFHDSRYLVGEEDPSNLFKNSNITITPNFDKWAGRGVSFRNMWSSTPSSRALESVLFAQVPYDNVAKTAVAGGRADTPLSGMPQLFSAKGYETFFTSGSVLNYDSWDEFLPTHGFSTIWSWWDVVKMARSDYNLTFEHWNGVDKRGFAWGAHDDVSFQLVGDMLVNRTKDQSERVAQGEPKTPLFLLHYTISSHAPFTQRPTWYAESDKPDFSALYKDLEPERAEAVKNYLEMRNFADMELGKFMDRLEKEGILNDTIVLLFGDHGRAPEFKKSDFRDVSVTRVPAAIIAEGRLGDSAGLVIDDATEHYDFLNTMMDIVGVPEEGFLQDGVGRSLKRKAPFGERFIFSNNPTRKMSIVRGHQRLQYDRAIDTVLLHDVDKDHDMQTDLFSSLTAEEKAEWLTWRDTGREISRYFLKRWDSNCLLAVNCVE